MLDFETIIFLSSKLCAYMYFFLLSLSLTCMRTPIVGAAARLVYFTAGHKLTILYLIVLWCHLVSNGHYILVMSTRFSSGEKLVSNNDVISMSCRIDLTTFIVLGLYGFLFCLTKRVWLRI